MSSFLLESTSRESYVRSQVNIDQGQSIIDNNPRYTGRDHLNPFVISLITLLRSRYIKVAWNTIGRTYFKGARPGSFFGIFTPNWILIYRWGCNHYVTTLLKEPIIYYIYISFASYSFTCVILVHTLNVSVTSSKSAAQPMASRERHDWPICIYVAPSTTHNLEVFATLLAKTKCPTSNMCHSFAISGYNSSYWSPKERSYEVNIISQSRSRYQTKAANHWTNKFCSCQQLQCPKKTVYQSLPLRLSRQRHLSMAQHWLIEWTRRKWWKSEGTSFFWRKQKISWE